MSEMEYNKGTLTLVSSDVKSFCIHLAAHNDIKGSYDFNDLSMCHDFLGDEFNEKYVIIGDKVYYISFSVQRGDLDYINNLTRISPVEFAFETYHHNGGAHWTELLKEELLKVQEEN